MVIAINLEKEIERSFDITKEEAESIRDQLASSDTKRLEFNTSIDNKLVTIYVHVNKILMIGVSEG